MTSHVRFIARMSLVIVSLAFMSAVLSAQAPAPISFDALPRAQQTAAPSTAPRATRTAPANQRSQSTVAAASHAPAKTTATTVRGDTAHVVNVAMMVDSAEQRRHAPDVAPVSSVPAHSAPPAPVAPATPAPATAATHAPAAPTFQAPVVTGLLQVLVSGGDGAQRSTYRIRRAEVKIVSDLGRKSQAVVMVDVAKALSLSTSGAETSVAQSSRVLQDAYISLPLPHVQIDGGQQRVPLGYEGSMSASGLETVERALMESSKSRGASFGDVRDLGLAARGSVKSVDYRAGLFNGTGETMNDVDKNVAKAGAALIGWRVPFVKGLRIGASGATSGAATGDKPARDRVGADIRYVRGIFTVQSEAMTGQDGILRRAGMYVLGAAGPTKTVKIVARFDAWDPDTKTEATAASVTERDYLAGATWLPAATRLKLQLAVVRKTYTHNLTPAATLLLTQLQASW